MDPITRKLIQTITEITAEQNKPTPALATPEDITPEAKKRLLALGYGTDINDPEQMAAYPERDMTFHTKVPVLPDYAKKASITALQAGIPLKDIAKFAEKTLTTKDTTVTRKGKPKQTSGINEANAPVTDEEGGMAIGELEVISQKAQELARMMQNDTQLEAWVQSKITKAKDYISSVHDYMHGNPDKVG